MLSEFYSLKIFRTWWSNDCERKYGNSYNGWFDKLDNTNIYDLIKFFFFKDNINSIVSTDAQGDNYLDINNQDGMFFVFLNSFSTFR